MQTILWKKCRQWIRRIASRDQEVCLSSSTRFGDQEQKKEAKENPWCFGLHFSEYFSKHLSKNCVLCYECCLLRLLQMPKINEKKKNYLRSTMRDDNLYSRITRISSENKKAQSIDLDEVVNAFALTKRQEKQHT